MGGLQSLEEDYSFKRMIILSGGRLGEGYSA